MLLILSEKRYEESESCSGELNYTGLSVVLKEWTRKSSNDSFKGNGPLCSVFATSSRNMDLKSIFSDYFTISK